MDKRDFYNGQYPDQSDFDIIADLADEADKDFLLAHAFPGVVSGLTVNASAGAPTFNAIVAAGTAYDKDGEHLYVSLPQTIDVSVDELGATTYTDLGGGEDRWVSVFLHFDRAQSDPHVDDDGVTVYFVQAESYIIRVVNGTKGAAPVTEPALDASDILLADIYMYVGIADVIASDIHVHRREEIGYYRSATGGLVKHKNDTMKGPDTDTIEDTWDDANAISQTKHYGARTVEVRGRSHERITSRIGEFNDDFNHDVIQGVWLKSIPIGAPVEGPSASHPWGVYSVTLRNAFQDKWLALGNTYASLKDQLVFEVAMMCATAPDAEYAVYFGVENAGAIAHMHTEEGFGFYHSNGNWFAKNVSAGGAAVTATNTLVPITTLKFQRLRAHCVCNSAGVPTKILFYINEALVATHTTNLPTTALAAFRPFLFYTTPGVTTGNKIIHIDRYFMGGLRRDFHE